MPRSPIRTRSTTPSDRLQGRDVTGVKNPDGPADPLIVHPDVRRSTDGPKELCNEASPRLSPVGIDDDRRLLIVAGDKKNDADGDHHRC